MHTAWYGDMTRSDVCQSNIDFEQIRKRLSRHLQHGLNQHSFFFFFFALTYLCTGSQLYSIPIQLDLKIFDREVHFALHLQMFLQIRLFVWFAVKEHEEVAPFLRRAASDVHEPGTKTAKFFGKVS